MTSLVRFESAADGDKYVSSYSRATAADDACSLLFRLARAFTMSRSRVYHGQQQTKAIWRQREREMGLLTSVLYNVIL